jgi:hypothetical protein
MSIIHIQVDAALDESNQKTIGAVIAKIFEVTKEHSSHFFKF